MRASRDHARRDSLQLTRCGRSAGQGGCDAEDSFGGDGGNSMDVKGTIKDGESRIILDGYCKFDAKLVRK